MICGHGSRDEEAVAEFQSLARGMRERLPQYDVESGFLEFARPTIQEGLKKLMERGVTEILAAPAILFAAGHVKNDIPWELNSFAASHPVLSLLRARPLHRAQTADGGARPHPGRHGNRGGRCGGG
jgi:sirohydrochlorin cobaltochelatase